MTPVPAGRALSRRHVLGLGALVGLALTLPMALLVAPPDAVQGEAQRWMYLHVPAAWAAYACFAVVLVASLQVLRTGAVERALMARAAAEVGLVLTVLTLLTGSVWGRFTWGVWWVWDARILTTVALALVYAAYLALVHLAPRRPRIPAVLGVVGFLLVPVVHMSVVWWRTLHQPPTILAPEAGLPIDPVMGATLALAVLTTSLAAAWAVLTRLTGLDRTRQKSRQNTSNYATGHAMPSHRARGGVCEPGSTVQELVDR